MIISIPKKDFKVTIGGFIIHVKYDNTKTDLVGMYGCYHSSHHTIYLQEEFFDDQRLNDTLIHEIFHGICDIYSIKFDDRHIKEEEAVTRLSTARLVFMNSNKHLFDKSK